MRDSFANGFQLFISQVLSAHSPPWLAMISSTITTPIFAAITGPCNSVAISITGDLDLYERTLYYILQNNDRFPALKEIFYHCSRPLTFSTCYTYCYIPRSLQPPVHLPATLRVVTIHLHIPISVQGGRAYDTRHYRVEWDLHRPGRSTVYTGSEEPSAV